MAGRAHRWPALASLAGTRALDAMARTRPDGAHSPEGALDRALEALVEKLARTRFAATSRPRPGQEPVPGSRVIPADVARSVWRRDGGRCAFVGRGGRRCESTAFLEFHHVEPYGVGGRPTVENIAVRCQAHNLYEAEVFYGRRWNGTLAHGRRLPQGVHSPRGEFPSS
jgi:hypothetical protein